MLDIGWQELFIVAILAIIVVGPKDLPRALKTVMHYVRKARGLAREFQSGVDEMVREADLDDLKKDLTKISDSKGLENTIKEAVDPDGDLDKELDFAETEQELNRTARDAVKETEPDAKPSGDSGTASVSGQDKKVVAEAAPKTETVFTDASDPESGEKEWKSTAAPAESSSGETGDDAKSPATTTNS